MPDNRKDHPTWRSCVWLSAAWLKKYLQRTKAPSIQQLARSMSRSYAWRAFEAFFNGRSGDKGGLHMQFQKFDLILSESFAGLPYLDHEWQSDIPSPGLKFPHRRIHLLNVQVELQALDSVWCASLKLKRTHVLRECDSGSLDRACKIKEIPRAQLHRCLCTFREVKVAYPALLSGSGGCPSRLHAAGPQNDVRSFDDAFSDNLLDFDPSVAHAVFSKRQF